MIDGVALTRVTVPGVAVYVIPAETYATENWFKSLIVMITLPVGMTD